MGVYGVECYKQHYTVAPLIFPFQAVNELPLADNTKITTEMHMHDGTEVCHLVCIFIVIHMSSARESS